MKQHIRSFTLAALVAAALTTPASAIQIPVTADTAGSTVKKTITKAAGTAATLPISAKSTALLFFDLSNSGITSSAVTSARLIIYFPKVTKPGNLDTLVPATAFLERFITPTKPLPAVSNPSGLVAITPVNNKGYVVIPGFEVAVQGWLTTPATNTGIALTGDATLSALISSREGAGVGAAAILEIDVSSLDGSVSGTTAVFTGGVSAGSLSSTAGDVSAAGNVLLSSAANRTVSVAPEPANGTNGHSLTIKAGNAISGALAQTGGDLILEAGNGFNINQPSADGGDLILRSGGNSRTAASTNDGGDIVFQVGSFNSAFIEKARLLEGGNFGLGTATPEDLLHLNGAGGTRLLISTTAASFAGVRTRSTSREYFTGLSANANDFIVQDNTAGATRLRILPSGNVGLGTDTPQAKVHVVIPATGVGQEYAFEVGKNDSSFANAILVMRTFGTGTPFNLELSQGDAFKPGGGAWSVFSDRRLKKNIEPLSGALDRLLQLRSVTYEYIDPTAVHELPGVQTGFVAQEVEPIFPNWVGEKADGMKYVAVKGFESLTVQALRELRSEKDAQIEKLRAENTALAQKVATLEARDQARVALDAQRAALDARRTTLDAELQARLARLESALDDAPVRSVRTALETTPGL